MRAAFLHLLVGGLCFLRTAAEESPFPRELLDRLSHSEIRSISDLQRLLEVDFVEREVIQETKQRYHKDFSQSDSSLKTHTRRRRSIAEEEEEEEALPAACQTRTVVHEIPRSQVDATSANFLLWPSCVELQRCTGCCNTGSMRCTPARKHHRLVKVAKVEYVRRRPRLKEVLVRLEEHLACVCVNRHHPTHTKSHKDNGLPLPTAKGRKRKRIS